MDEEECSSLAAQVVRGLLERHGVAKHKQSAVIAQMFGLSRSAAHRRISGMAHWTLEELQQIAGAYGETLAEVLEKDASSGEKGVLEVEGKRVDCLVWLGEPATAATTQGLVAKQDRGLYVITTAPPTTGAPHFRVNRLEFSKLARPGMRRIAVLDDDRDTADGLCAQLRRQGYEAKAYYDAASFKAESASEKFDGYVLDWVLGNATAGELIVMLRDQGVQSPIAILSGYIHEENDQLHQIAAAQATHKVQVVGKPILLPLVISALTLGSQAQHQGAESQ